MEKNILNNFYGDVKDTLIQQDTTNSNQSQNILKSNSSINYDELLSTVKDIQNSMNIFNLDSKDIAKVESNLNEIETNAKIKNPDRKIFEKHFEKIKEIMSKVSVSVISSSIILGINAIIDTLK